MSLTANSVDVCDVGGIIKEYLNRSTGAFAAHGLNTGFFGVLK